MKKPCNSVFKAAVLFASLLLSSPSVASTQHGIASVYRGGKTANGECATASALTAAHRTLPFGTMLQVTNGRTGRSVVVRVNDRGPFVRGRVIDLTPAGARAIGFSGLASVTLAVLATAGASRAQWVGASHHATRARHASRSQHAKRARYAARARQDGRSSQRGRG